MSTVKYNPDVLQKFEQMKRIRSEMCMPEKQSNSFDVPTIIPGRTHETRNIRQIQQRVEQLQNDRHNQDLGFSKLYSQENLTYNRTLLHQRSQQVSHLVDQLQHKSGSTYHEMKSSYEKKTRD